MTLNWWALSQSTTCRLPSKLPKLSFWSKKMRNILKLMKNSKLKIPRKFIERNSETLTSLLRGFNPKESGAWGRSPP